MLVAAVGGAKTYTDVRKMVGDVGDAEDVVRGLVGLAVGQRWPKMSAGAATPPTLLAVSLERLPFAVPCILHPQIGSQVRYVRTRLSDKVGEALPLACHFLYDKKGRPRQSKVTEFFAGKHVMGRSAGCAPLRLPLLPSHGTNSSC